MKKTDANLREDVSVFDMLGEYGGWLVVVGVVAEVIYAVLYREGKSFWQTFTPAIASGLVAFGVIIEIFSARKGADARDELVTRSNNKLAEALDRVADVEFANGFIEEKLEMATNDLAKANRGLGEAIERAAKAELETERLKAQLAPRDLTEAQFLELQNLKGKIAAVAMTTPADFESTRFAGQIASALKEAGIDVLIGAERSGAVWQNIYLVFPSGSAHRPPYLLTHPLAIAFQRAGFLLGAGDRTQVPLLDDLPPDLPVIMVGEKGVLRQSEPPFMARFPMPKPSAGEK